MFCKDVCLGTSHGINKIRRQNDDLNARVLDQVSESQELVMLTSFARESNDYQYKKCVQDRISDVASWHWVLEDLTKRLDESIAALKYEHKALRVVIKRVQEEIDGYSQEASRPGAICPLTDSVEEAIMKEYEFLRDQKKSFENLILELDKKTAALEKVKNRIASDVLNKNQAMNVDELCATKDYTNVYAGDWKKKRKKGITIARWMKRCGILKRSGLKAICNALVTRQQVRGARVQLSITAQAYAAKVDSALRRRLHTNKIKLQDLEWQREEAIRDYNSLGEELAATEKTLVEAMNQERMGEAKLADRNQRPTRELTKDEVNRNLREEQCQMRRFVKELRNNINGIMSLQNNLTEAISHIDCCAEDLVQVIRLDEDRIRCRQGNEDNSSGTTASTSTSDVISRTSENSKKSVPSGSPQLSTASVSSRPSATSRNSHTRTPSDQLTVIREEDEEDDYPFDF